MMSWLFTPPSTNDLIRLLKAWRFWSVGALLGALLGAAAFYVAPPPFRARATVLVDFNLEQAWPEETDRQQFYYLERETRKLEEIAWSDSVMASVAMTGEHLTIQELRSGKLSLSQPAEGGWHFYAEDENPQRAAAMASTWAEVFAEQVSSRAMAGDGLNSFIEVHVLQTAQLPVERSIPISTHLFVGAFTFLAVASFFVLFFAKPA